MAQISRPFQVVIAAFVLFAGVWAIALRPHSSGSSSSSGSAASAPAATPSASSSSSSSSSASASAEAKHAAAPTPVIHGSAPGVEGLSKAIAKAHGAVATSQQNAKTLEEKSQQASSPSSSSSQSTPTTSAVAPKTATSAAPSHSATPSTSASTGAGSGSAATTTAPGMQTRVEAALKQGKIAVILFWNPRGTDDVAVRAQVQKLHGGLAIFHSGADEVAQFGTITRGVQVQQTPTVMIVNQHGIARSITGLTDAFSIEQAIAEARHA